MVERSFGALALHQNMWSVVGTGENEDGEERLITAKCG